MKKLLPIAALALLSSLAAAPAVLAQASAAQAAGKTKPSPLAPSEIVAAASKSDWTRIAPSDLLVMDLSPDAKGRARRVVIQLMPPPFSQGWIGNIRKLAAAHWWDGMSINRVQDNYVVQWGDPNADDKVKAKPLPAGLATMAESEYTVAGMTISEAEATSIDFGTVNPRDGAAVFERMMSNAAEKSKEQDRIAHISIDGTQTTKTKDGWHERDSFAEWVEIHRGWPLAAAGTGEQTRFWPIHCYGMVGVGRDLSPNTGSGAELYVVIGHAPRHLDRNIALVGRVIEGIEYLSSLPRGHGGLGFYDLAQGDKRVRIRSIHPGPEVKDLPPYEYLSTESASFAKYADARANRRDAFFIRPAGGADICNIPVPVRRVK